MCQRELTVSRAPISNTAHDHVKSPWRREHSLTKPTTETSNSKLRLSLKDSISQASSWGILLPSLCFWPFVSAFPAFSILSDASDITKFTVQAAFFATGFWALGTVAAVAAWVRLPADAAKTGGKSSRTISIVGAYSLLWMVAYAIAVLRGWA